jgi:signal peptidase I
MRELLRQSARASLAGEVLRRTGRVLIRLYGTSMLPALWPGDLVFFVTCDPGCVVTGDVLLCCCDDRLIVHRVTAVVRHGGDLQVVTQGDTQLASDLPIPAQQVLGRAVGVRCGASPAQQISRRRSKLNVAFSWIAARSTLVCEIALRIHAITAKIRSYFSSTPESGSIIAEVRT